jgi:hypothetical protein
LTDDERQEIEALRLVQTMQRTKVWKQIDAYLRERRDQFELDILGQAALSDTDRALLHGKLAMLLECLLFLPRTLAERELADRSPSPTADDPMAVLTDPVQRPEMM